MGVRGRADVVVVDVLLWRLGAGRRWDGGGMSALRAALGFVVEAVAVELACIITMAE